MATIQGPLHSGQATGSVEGVTYSEDQWDHTARARITCNNVRSTSNSKFKREVWEWCAFHWANISISNYDRWVEWSINKTGRNKLGDAVNWNAKIWFFKINSQRLFFFPGSGSDSPPSDNSIYNPNFSIEWTVNGASLSWDIELDSNFAIAVWQKRNLRVAQVREKKLQLSQILYYPTTSPYLVTGAALAPNDPPGFPLIVGNRYINFKVQSCTREGIVMPPLYFRVHNP